MKKSENSFVSKLKSFSEQEVMSQKDMLLDEVTKDKSENFKEIARVFLDVYGEPSGFLKPGTFRKTFVEIAEGSIRDLLTEKVIESNPQIAFDVICKEIQAGLEYDKLEPEFEIYKKAVQDTIAKDEDRFVVECKEMKKLYTSNTGLGHKIDFLGDRLTKIKPESAIELFTSVVGRKIERPSLYIIHPTEVKAMSMTEKLSFVRETHLPAYLEKFPSSKQILENPKVLKGAVLEIALEINDIMDAEKHRIGRTFVTPYERAEFFTNKLLWQGKPIIDKINEVFTSPNFEFDSPEGKALAATIDDFLETSKVENNDLKVEFLNAIRDTNYDGMRLDSIKIADIVKNNPEFMQIVTELPSLKYSVSQQLIKDAAGSIRRDYEADFIRGELKLYGITIPAKDIYTALEGKGICTRGIREISQGNDGLYRLAMEYHIDHLEKFDHLDKAGEMFKVDKFGVTLDDTEVAVLLALGVMPNNIEELPLIDAKTRGLVEGFAKIDKAIGFDIKISSTFKTHQERQDYIEFSLIEPKDFDKYKDYDRKCQAVCDVIVSSGRKELVDYVAYKTPFPEIREKLCKVILERVEDSSSVRESKDRHDKDDKSELSLDKLRDKINDTFVDEGESD